MKSNKKILLSGIQPSGQLHIGNYFGAMRQFVEFQDKYDTYISIVNFHALTTIHDRDTLRQHTIDAVIDHLGALFVASDADADDGVGGVAGTGTEFDRDFLTLAGFGGAKMKSFVNLKLIT